MPPLRRISTRPLPATAPGRGPVYQASRGGHYPPPQHCGRDMVPTGPDAWSCRACHASQQN